MTACDYKVAIVGAGPAGLSAAARVAKLDSELGAKSPSYVLLEGFKTASKTIFDYQKGKYVMAEPDFLPLRSDLTFEAGKRETILDNWSSGLGTHGVNIRYQSEVASISGQQGAFTIALSGSEKITAENIILSIGLQGNPRRLGVDGDTHPLVQYTLADPSEFSGETIVVVGAGDAAIENAVALTAQNKVIIVNRKTEFARAKQGNLNAVLAGLNNKALDFSCMYGSSVKSMHIDESADMPLQLTFNTPEGEKIVACHRVIARLGAVPPRSFVENCGVVFPEDRQDALPELSESYESNVSGLYIIGALAGYPLIKQAMNQGFDVASTLYGKSVQPVEYDLLAEQFKPMQQARSVEDHIAWMREQAPILGQINTLLLREVLLESRIHYSFGADTKPSVGDNSPRIWRPNDYLFRNGDFSNTFYHIVAGSITVKVKNKQGKELSFTLTAGMYVGEMSLLSNSPRNGDAIIGENTVLVETPRRIMLKILNTYEDIRLGIDWVFITRALQNFFAPGAATPDIRKIAETVDLRLYPKGKHLFDQGDPADSLYFVRSGTVGLNVSKHGQQISLSQAKAGQVIGELVLMGQTHRAETATALTQVEIIRIDREKLDSLLSMDATAIQRINAEASERLIKNSTFEALPERGEVLEFLLSNGLGEATNALVINENLCVGCDNCETACAETHNGISRLDRKASVGYNNWQIPTNCRHCDNPHCMKDCPPNAIVREPSGAVVIQDTCIGCGNCESNCPYGAITLSYPVKRKGNFLSWLMLGKGDAPGKRTASVSEKEKEKGKKSMKCDACSSNPGGPACVRACPTGAAQRISPEQFIQLIEVQ